ncbi:diguanylate cyclase [Sphingopyxis sp.]|uniref:diguanylate cyclase n=1 Tax=Sphingopyxis sp. TaxID=1908224 RepID=UPI002D7946CD|nr:diguanylate cyclase [Sphingopyxis sp.]HET6523565.1 diguanylate cyclase [Sphingopyxis sp.]
MELALGAWSRAASERCGAPTSTPRRLAAGPSRSALPGYFAMAPIALCIIDRQRRFEAVNERMAELAGVAAGQLAGRFAASLLADADTILSSCFAKADAGEQLRNFIIPWQDRWLELSFSVLAENGQVQALCVAAADITRRVHTERRLLRSHRRLLSIATRDHLTGLLNRRGLEMRLRQELRRAGAARSRVAVLLVDIDHFKLYNDHFGHPAGDRCLRVVSAALEQCGLGAAASVARYGGEEFALVVPDASPRAAAELADQCRRAVNSLAVPHPAADREKVTISVGVAVLDLGTVAGSVAAHAAELLRASDESLYRAKRSGRDRVSVASFAH